jgi:hypothetical protein
MLFLQQFGLNNRHTFSTYSTKYFVFLSKNYQVTFKSHYLYTMQFIKTILNFRLQQIWRMLKSIGVILLLLALPMIGVFLLSALKWLSEVDWWTAALAVFGCLLFLHFHRPDKKWLMHLPFKKRQLFLIEYSFAILPMSIAMVGFFQDWIIAGLFQVSAIAVSFIPNFNAKKTQQTWFLNLNKIPIEAFEWRVGLRKTFPLIFLYLIGFFVAKYIAGVSIICLLIIMLGMSFYETLEPKELLEASLLKAGLLKRKVWVHSCFIHTTFLPLYALFLFFHLKYWYFLLLLLLVVQASLLFAIFFKYAHYLPRRQKAPNQTPVGLFFLGLVVPFFTPGAIVALFIYWRKAVKRINYFYANHH